MNNSKQEFLSFAFDSGALRFGEFTLNSGRNSPYFYNSASFSNGSNLATLAEFYARKIIEHVEGEFMLFGPAYKGIPLVAATAIALDQSRDSRTPYAFDRKEAKDHGDRGWTVGAPIRGKVIIVEDVITSGLSIGKAAKLIREHNAHPAAAIISLDRSEFAVGSQTSAADSVRKKHGIEVFALANAYDLMEFVENTQSLKQHASRLRSYMDRYAA